MAPICVLNTPTDEVLTHSCKEDLQGCPPGSKYAKYQQATTYNVPLSTSS